MTKKKVRVIKGKAVKKAVRKIIAKSELIKRDSASGRIVGSDSNDPKSVYDTVAVPPRRGKPKRDKSNGS